MTDPVITTRRQWKRPPPVPEPPTPGGGGGGASDHGAMVTMQSYQNVDPATDYEVALDSPTWDTDGYSVGTIIVVPAGLGGYYEIDGGILLTQPNATDPGAPYIGAILVNETDLSNPSGIVAADRRFDPAGAATSGILMFTFPTAVYFLSAGDEVRVFLQMPASHSGALQAAVGNTWPYVTFLRVRKVGTSGGLSGAVVGLTDQYTAGPAPHHVAFDSGAVQVDYPVYDTDEYISGDTFVLPSDGVYRLWFSHSTNIKNDGPVPAGTWLYMVCNFTGWWDTHSAYGFGPMSGMYATGAEAGSPTGFYVMGSGTADLVGHAGDTVYPSFQSADGEDTSVGGLFGIQRLGDIPEPVGS